MKDYAGIMILGGLGALAVLWGLVPFVHFLIGVPKTWLSLKIAISVVAGLVVFVGLLNTDSDYDY